MLEQKYEAGTYHLQQLCDEVVKEEHFLRVKDLNHKDKQNYDAIQ